MKPQRLPSPLPVGIAVAAHQLLLPSFRPSPPLICIFLLLLTSSPAPCSALKCLDCVGRDCMGSTCEGDYCLISHYAPRWGPMVLGEPDMVKGCLSGGMLRGDVRSHCEIGDGQEEEEEQPFTCLCNGQDFCNRDWAVRRLEVEPVPLYTCVCQGPHCQGRSTCTGQLCTFVQNHRSRASEQGCANASVPLLERRTSGACMIPPITGAMHHNTVAKTALDLLHTESCVCEGDYCNSRKPRLTVPENSRGPAFVYVEVMGQRVSSRNVSCHGEFCFRAEIRSQLGQMSKYRVMGCASFANDAQLAEELDPTGCANFNSEKLQVEVCFQTEDRAAIARARDRRQRGGGGVRKPSSRTRDWPRSSEQERDEGGEIDEWPEEEFDKQ